MELTVQELPVKVDSADVKLTVIVFPIIAVPLFYFIWNICLNLQMKIVIN